MRVMTTKCVFVAAVLFTRAALAQTPDPPPATPALKIGALTTAGVSVAALVLGLKFGADARAIDHDLDFYRRFTCPVGTGASICDGTGHPALPLSTSEAMSAKAKKDDLARTRRFRTGAFVVSGVAALASGYLFYRWASAGPEVSVVPVADVDGNLRPGFTLALRF
jgi:hypothetical protein